MWFMNKGNEEKKDRKRVWAKDKKNNAYFFTHIPEEILVYEKYTVY